eukprot:g1727.t1
MSQLTIARTFDQWADTAQTLKELRHRTQVAVARWQKRGLNAVLLTWMGLVDDRQLCRRVLNKLIQHYTHGNESRAFVAWCSFVSASQHEEAEDSRRELIVQRVAKRMSQLTIARTFDQWTETVGELRAHRAKVKQSLFKWTRRSLNAVMITWMCLVDDRTLCRRVLNRLIKRYELVFHARAFVTWRSFMLQCEQDDADDARREAIARRCAKRISQLTIARTFTRWSEFLHEIKAHKHKVQLCLLRWQRRGLAAAVVSWSTFVDNRVLARRVMRQILGRYKHSLRSKGFVSWRAWMLGNRRADADADRRRASSAKWQALATWRAFVQHSHARALAQNHAVALFFARVRAAQRGRVAWAMGRWRNGTLKAMMQTSDKHGRRRIEGLARHHTSFVLRIIIQRLCTRTRRSAFSRWATGYYQLQYDQMAAAEKHAQKIEETAAALKEEKARLRKDVADLRVAVQGAAAKHTKHVEKAQGKWLEEREALVARALADRQLLDKCRDKLQRGMYRLRELRLLKGQLRDSWRLTAYWRSQFDVARQLCAASQRRQLDMQMARAGGPPAVVDGGGGSGRGGDSGGGGGAATLDDRDPEKLAESWMGYMDVDGDGKLSLEELASGFRRLKSTGASSRMMMTLESPEEIRQQRRRREQEAKSRAGRGLGGGSDDEEADQESGISYAEIQSAWRGGGKE